MRKIKVGIYSNNLRQEWEDVPEQEVEQSAQEVVGLHADGAWRRGHDSVLANETGGVAA